MQEEQMWLELRSYDGRLLTQWAILVGENASEIDVNAEIAWLRDCPEPGLSNAARLLDSAPDPAPV